MAQLSTIIGSILHDFIQAQHEANNYSLTLGPEYGENGKNKGFQLPNAVIGDLEFELKYAVKEEGEEREKYEIDYPRLRRFFREASEQFARISVTSVVSTVSRSSIGVNDTFEKYHEFMRKEDVLKQEFCVFLGRKINGVLTERTSEIIDPVGTIEREVLLGAVTETVRSEFLMHPELDDLFSGKAGKELREEAEEELRYAIDGLMSKLLGDFNCVRRYTVPSIDVIVNADELQKLPDEAIQCIKFKISQGDMVAAAKLSDEE